MESSDKEDYEAKQKAFYSAMIAAWLNTRLERDKQLLGLSVTAIGLLVTLLRTVGVSSLLQIILWLFSFLCGSKKNRDNFPEI
jgi:nucleoid-associated protein YejK